MSDRPTCKQCRHWGPGTHIVQRFDCITDKQSQCWVDHPAKVTKPLQWQWKPACEKFAPDMRKYTKEAA